MNDFKADAEHFINNETQFHLGMLPTEQSHPKTKELSWTLEKDIDAGISMLLSVDRDIEDVVDNVFAGAPYKELLITLNNTLRNGGRICFSGCGSTGRLSILLESCWRTFWRDMQKQEVVSSDLCKKMSNQVCSIMTGGDFALIRSVEGFEDYIPFGRQQVVEAGLSKGDVLVAISEGGETSSVIGTILEARDRGSKAFFAYNNPSNILSEHIERSKNIIGRDDVTKLDLCTGPMGVAGSTRMQATTIELLVIGTALDSVLIKLLPDILSADKLSKLPNEWKTKYNAKKLFTYLLDDLSCNNAISALKDWVEIERDLYKQKGRITYYADEFLLDIFTDTTERAPTFMLPPFKKLTDKTSAPSWAFVKDPLHSTPETWQHILARTPRCLEWNKSTYKEIDAPTAVYNNPPLIGCNELYKLPIGKETDDSRYNGVASIAMAVLHDKEISNPDFKEWLNSFGDISKSFSKQNITVIGASIPAELNSKQVLHIPCRITSSPLGLWTRLASKLVLNTISTATMGCCGRLTGNWMAHVDTSNKKLIDRGTRLISELAEVDYKTACYALHQTISELKLTVAAKEEYPSPVAETIRRLTQK